MRLLLFVLLLLISTVSSKAQTAQEAPTLNVLGSAKLSVKPDLGVLIISIKAIDLNFSQAITSLNKKTVDISKQIAAIGFKADDIKTTDFTIDTYTVYQKEQNIDSGYVANQNVKVEFKNNQETITKILNTFSKSQTDFTLRFNFKLSDDVRAKVQDELVKLAIQSARQKAKLIAETSGVRLGKIKDISYGSNYYGGMQEIEDRAAVGASAAGAMAEPLIGFTPNDLEFIDNVYIVWKLK